MTQSIDEFVEQAKSYCALIEHLDDFTTEDFLARVREILPLLYHHAAAMPLIDATYDKIDLEISHEEWSELFDRLNRKLGKTHNTYWIIFDPLQIGPDDPVAGSLSDDLTDIWRNLKDGLLHWANCSPTMRSEIVWHWRFSFRYHWSYHLVNALRAINWMLEHDWERDFDDEE